MDKEIDDLISQEFKDELEIDFTCNGGRKLVILVDVIYKRYSREEEICNVVLLLQEKISFPVIEKVNKIHCLSSEPVVEK